MIVVNLFGGPGSGKSTTRAGLFYLMKLAGFKVEEAPEWIKHKVYEGDPYPFKDQMYTFAKQNKMVRELDGKVDWCVTDSPLLLSLIYGEGRSKTFEAMVHETYDSYTNINIFIDRVKPYAAFGRNQTEDEAREKDREILEILSERGDKVFHVPGNELAPGTILAYIQSKLTDMPEPADVTKDTHVV